MNCLIRLRQKSSTGIQLCFNEERITGTRIYPNYIPVHKHPWVRGALGVLGAYHLFQSWDVHKKRDTDTYVLRVLYFDGRSAEVLFSSEEECKGYVRKLYYDSATDHLRWSKENGLCPFCLCQVYKEQNGTACPRCKVVS